MAASNAQPTLLTLQRDFPQFEVIETDLALEVLKAALHPPAAERHIAKRLQGTICIDAGMTCGKETALQGAEPR